MKVVLEKSVAKQINKINEPLKSRIVNALIKLSKEPVEGDIKKISEPVIEADLTQEEIKLIENGYKEYKTSPENYVSLETAFSASH